jgi:methylthioribose-1-phosphate isomerase
MPVPALEWIGGFTGHLKIVDQTALPEKLSFIEINSTEPLLAAIKRLAVRGAPAIGIAAAFGLFLGIRESRASGKQLLSEIDKVSALLFSVRPTAVNVKNALARMKKIAAASSAKSANEIKSNLLREAQMILEEDRQSCRKLGENCQEFIRDGDTVLTNCNAGSLATGGIGTALSGIYVAKELGKKVRVFACETRPLLQGARLTTYELMQEGIDVTLICDNTAGTVMKSGKISSVFVGADRIASNGDSANKIGTYPLSVLAREHAVPFYIVAPLSSFDFSIKTGDEIPIEERSPEEVTEICGKKIAPRGVKVFSPAFDVTPAEFITAIICEKGAVRKISSETLTQFAKPARSAYEEER